jgi:hypothetical protein
MLKEDAMNFYGTVSLVAEKAGVTTQAVYKWPDIVPLSSAGMLFARSGHKIDFRQKDYSRESDRTGRNPAPQTP